MLIVTLAHQRSGTKLLGSLYDSTGVIISHGEVFNPDQGVHQSFRSFIEKKGIEKIYRAGTFASVHEYIMGLQPGKSHIHIDLMFNQIEHACVSWNDYLHPFIYSYFKRVGALVILLTRSAEDIFVSMKLMHQLPSTHTRADEEQDRGILGAVTLSRSELSQFENELQFQYGMARRFFSTYDWFTEIDYTELAGNQIPQRVFELMERRSQSMNQGFNWSSFPPLSSPWVKNASRFEIEWID